MKRFPLVLVILIGFLLLPPTVAYGQEPTETPTPTITPTPAYQQEVTLSSGNTLKIERVIDYGDVAIVIMLLVQWITFVLVSAVQIPRLFTQR